MESDERERIEIEIKEYENKGGKEGEKREKWSELAGKIMEKEKKGCK